MKKNNIKRIVDLFMLITILFLMAMQVTDKTAHQFLGILMFVFIIIHQVLNINWYKSLFKGSYNKRRIIFTVINVLLIISFLMTILSGLSMSKAFPIIYGIINENKAWEIHLAMSHIAFLIMSIHIGLHMRMMVGNISKKIYIVINIIFICITIFGLYMIVQNRYFDYILVRTKHIYHDYSKSNVQIIIENFCEFFSIAFITDCIMKLIKV